MSKEVIPSSPHFDRRRFLINKPLGTSQSFEICCTAGPSEMDICTGDAGSTEYCLSGLLGRIKMITKRNVPRILIADDHTLVAEACKKLLESEYEVVATVSDGRSLVRAAAELRPHLIIVDVSMPLLNGLDAGQQIKEMMPSVKLVFLTMNHDADLAAEAFRRGASGYLLKTCAASELAIAVREVLRGKSYLSPMIAKDTVDFLLRQDKALVEEGSRLTERQREVLQLLAEGKCMKEVAGVLNLTTRTVAFHKYRIMEVLKARSNAELVQYAIRHHLIAA
jgi:DNA-binding NarL/FixJ family response regulator